MKVKFKSKEELPVTLNAEHIAGYLGISRGMAYALLNNKNCPTLRLGRRHIVPRDLFLDWIESNIGNNIDI